MKKYIVILFVSLGLFSCENYLTVDPPSQATDGIVSEEFADETMKSFYHGAFYALTNWFNSYAYPGHRGTLLAVDALGYDMIGTSGIYGGVVTQYNFATNNTLGSSVNITWRTYYNTIFNCNKAIEFYDKLATPSETSKIMYAQILALRSYCYFDLVRLWQKPYAIGKDLPVAVNMNGVIDMDVIVAGIPLSTVGQIYDILIADLEMAKQILIDANYNKSNFDEIDAEVAAMFLARAYLTRGTLAGDSGVKADMDAAIENAYFVRSSKRYRLMSKAEFVSGFNESSNPEFMWGLKQTSTNSDMSYVFNYLDIRPNDTRAYYKNAVPDPYFKKLFDYGNGYDIGDTRFSLFEYSTNGAPRVQDILVYTKFRYRESEKTADILYVRSAEAWFIEAEAKLRGGIGGNGQTAEQIIAEIRAQRGAITSGYTFNLDFLLKERRREFWGEGVAGIYDIQRTQSVLIRKELDRNDFPEYSASLYDGEEMRGGHYRISFPDGTAFTANSPYYYFQIPEQEFINNPAIDGVLPRD